MGNCWKLTPSQLTFGFECPACFYAEVKLGFKKPFTPFPSVFTKLDSAMRSHWQGRCPSELSDTLPPGRIDTKTITVKTEPLHISGHTSTCYISGKTDAIMIFNNLTHGVLDFKTTELKQQYVETYWRQLQSYTWGMEMPAKPQGQSLAAIQRMGLLVYDPAGLLPNGCDIAFERSWVEIERDDAKFEGFLSMILDILESDYPPTGKPKCDWCTLRNNILGDRLGATVH